MSLGLKKDDLVEIRSGRDRSFKKDRKRGKILGFRKGPKRMAVYVEGLNKVTKSLPKSEQNPKGSLIKIEAPIDISNVSLVCPKCGKITRIRAEIQDNKKKVRVCVKCQKKID